ncbi:DUF1385 domain-containing protein [Candidatus Oleimmundimicrobium sp.]|uniref:DUF1385 domain-containing protein n=1 Tax=Candidatus Oleimmundimicrobium sp. TaxID=3060597 RepID=UPI0027240FFD|nr:DUF1385 domain-containing protein [Candidatus Oleimmundimicrobium sp.]MDO8886090.1 DUF1385 domain-containing protein [Candidatus Oleimmundimicrobium sp.]
MNKINFNYLKALSIKRIFKKMNFLICSAFFSKAQVGGQAVLEGVMMRGKENWVLAVRKPSQEIVTEERKINSFSKKYPILKLPLIRGVVGVIEMLVIGTKAISLSAELATEGDEDVEISSKEMTISIFLAFVFGLLIFVVLPSWITVLLKEHLSSGVITSLFEGSLKAIIFLIYLIFISCFKDIRRVFEYHGAEHKTIHAYESGDELTPQAASKYSPLHVGCGTAFMLIALTVLIFIFAFLGRPPLVWRIISHLLLVPLVIGISYELIKLARKYKDSFLVKIVLAPGLWLQKLTTRDPSVDQLEVAIFSLKKLLSLEDFTEESEDCILQ